MALKNEFYFDSNFQMCSPICAPQNSIGGDTFKKIPCRYGRGCTHINDQFHRERYTHPSVPSLEPELVRNHYMCIECGQAFSSLVDLQIHLKKKTAWTNKSLIGARISCLVDSKEWHEGFVTHFRKNGKHCVEFKSAGERRWLNMTQIAFYIIESRHTPNTSNDEYKELDEPDEEPYNDEWIYVEDLTLDYAFAQSVLFKIFGGTIQETGHKTKGHCSLTEADRIMAKSLKGSLLYGELLPRGANKAFDPQHLNAKNAKVLFDLGSGTGKIAIQAFLQFRNLEYVFGIELSNGRYSIAEESVLNMTVLLGKDSFDIDLIPGRRIIVTEKPKDEDSSKRILHLECGNMMSVRNIDLADIVMLETDIPQVLHLKLCELIDGMHDGARILTYHDINKLWPNPNFPFTQLDVNVPLADRFPTSWSVQRGHHFFLWLKGNSLIYSGSKVLLSGRELDKQNDNSYNDNMANIAPQQSSGCFPWLWSFFSYVRRKSTADHENEKTVIPINDLNYDSSSHPRNKPDNVGFKKVLQDEAMIISHTDYSRSITRGKSSPDVEVGCNSSMEGGTGEESVEDMMGTELSYQDNHSTLPPVLLSSVTEDNCCHEYSNCKTLSSHYDEV